MANTHDTPTTRQSSDTMQEPSDSTTNAINIPDKVESEKTLAEHAHSNKDDSKKEQEEEKKGSMNDYFVSRQTKHNMLGVS